jgi:hypothetical protein
MNLDFLLGLGQPSCLYYETLNGNAKKKKTASMRIAFPYLESYT